MKSLLSIVIANYNYGRFLDEAIQSVLSQSCQDFEIIIIDGGSADNSVEVIQKYAGGLPPGVQRGDSSIVDLHLPPTPITYWVSEPDKGQSNAFNKGFAKAKGRFLTWLNADDVMLPGTIEKLKIAVERSPECRWFVGGVLWLDPQMKIIKCGRGRPFSEIRYKCGTLGVWGPSSFFSKELLEQVGGVDERFFYTMDTDLWLRFAMLANARYLPFVDYAWGLRLHPAAKMSGHNFSQGTGSYQGGLMGNADKGAARRLQLQREAQWRSDYLKPVKMTLLKRIASVSWLRMMLGYWDTLRYRGMHYQEFLKRRTKA